MPATRHRPLLVPGESCWRLVRADRLSLIVDAADYFSAAKFAMQRARRRIMLVGWDFDLRIRLEPTKEDPDLPDTLGRLIQHLVEQKPGLHAFILKWDMAMLMTIARQIVPLLIMHWLTIPRIHFRLDSSHPLDAAHHQKIMVIDDALAFCGGIDMTNDRWDTRDHAEGDPHRLRPNGVPYGPFHDVAAIFDGEAAQALGELSRRRWHRAGGVRLAPIPPHPVEWPKGVPVMLRDVEIAIARTEPRYRHYPQICEIERLYLAGIAAARHTIYMESQYLSSHAIRDALRCRLQESDGPEIIVINPESAEGWLESWVMDSTRARIVQTLRQADRYDRFRIFYPVNEAGTPIYVHAKVMIIDDWLLRIGSSNLNNRSMGFDTECDIAVEAPGQRQERDIRRSIIDFRNGLLAEHLGLTIGELEDTLDRTGSLIRTIDQLRRDDGRSLRLLPVRDLPEPEGEEIELHLFNPERPGRREKRLEHLLKRTINSPNPVTAFALALGLSLMVKYARRARQRPP